MRSMSFIFVVVVGLVSVGCGSDDDPIDSGGGDTGMAGDSGGGGDTGIVADTSGGDRDTGIVGDSGGGGGDTGPVGDGGPTDATPIDSAACVGNHPIVDGGARYCEPGNCYCGDGATLDTCYPVAIAEACCPVAVVCVP